MQLFLQPLQWIVNIDVFQTIHTFHQGIRMIQSKTLPGFLSKQASVTSTKNSTERKGGKKVTRSRMRQLKLLMMISMMKVYKKQYLFRQSYNDLHPNIQTFTFEQYTFKCFEVLEPKLTHLLQKAINQKENNPSPFRIQIRNIGCQSQQLKLRKQRWQLKSKYEQEVRQFQKLNSVIDRLERGSVANKSIEYLSVLKDIMDKLRTVIYKYFKKLSENDQENMVKIINVKFYCQGIYESFGQLISLLESLVDKDKNYGKYEKKYNRLKGENFEMENIIKHFQVLLFYFNCVGELKRMHEINPKLKEIAAHNPGALNHLVKLVIKLRHMLGYLTKEIINFGIAARPSTHPQSSQIKSSQIWKTIYERKYHTNSYKRRLRLE